MRRPSGREILFGFVIIAALAALGYSVYVRLDLGVFLATAIGSLAYVIVALYDNYIVTANLEIKFDPKAQDLYSTDLTLVDQNRQPTTNARVIRVLVENKGRKKARGCVGYLKTREQTTRLHDAVVLS